MAAQGRLVGAMAKKHLVQALDLLVVNSDMRHQGFP